VRTFTRRFRSETGLNPAQRLLQQRTGRARLQLLESSDLGVDQVSERCGFGTAAALRRQFQAVVGVSPTAYRRTYRPLARCHVSGAVPAAS